MDSEHLFQRGLRQELQTLFWIDWSCGMLGKNRRMIDERTSCSCFEVPWSCIAAHCSFCGIVVQNGIRGYFQYISRYFVCMDDFGLFFHFDLYALHKLNCRGSRLYAQTYGLCTDDEDCKASLYFTLNGQLMVITGKYPKVSSPNRRHTYTS